MSMSAKDKFLFPIKWCWPTWCSWGCPVENQQEYSHVMTGPIADANHWLRYSLNALAIADALNALMSSNNFFEGYFPWDSPMDSRFTIFFHTCFKNFLQWTSNEKVIFIANNITNFIELFFFNFYLFPSVFFSFLALLMDLIGLIFNVLSSLFYFVQNLNKSILPKFGNLGNPVNCCFNFFKCNPNWWMSSSGSIQI